MKNNPAREMWIIIILTVFGVIVAITHFVFVSFDMKEIFWVIFNMVVSGLFICAYALRSQKGVFYLGALYFSFNVFYHLITSPREFVAFGTGEVLESVSGLMYTISAVLLFISFFLCLGSTILERKRSFNVALIGIFTSATFALVQGIILIFVCNSGLKTWDACFPPLSMMVAFLILGFIYKGDYVKQNFKFLQEE